MIVDYYIDMRSYEQKPKFFNIFRSLRNCELVDDANERACQELSFALLFGTYNPEMTKIFTKKWFGVPITGIRVRQTPNVFKNIIFCNFFPYDFITKWLYHKKQ